LFACENSVTVNKKTKRRTSSVATASRARIVAFELRNVRRLIGFVGSRVRITTFEMSRRKTGVHHEYRNGLVTLFRGDDQKGNGSAKIQTDEQTSCSTRDKLYVRNTDTVRSSGGFWGPQPPPNLEIHKKYSVGF